ncbi:MAG: hypothetical protein MJZ45_00430 [Bacteroidales bacterium]|nr:hypothetical protein [Bacteroidales bacterium]
MSNQTSLETSLKGRLRNTNLPKADVLLPLFEAVVNSIHSIDERIEKQKDIDMENAYIKICVIRSAQSTIAGSKSEVCGFSVIDNGIGFNKDNYKSFLTLDSDYKIDKGCKGVGRLLWLKAFSSVSVESTYVGNEGTICKKDFSFNPERGLYDEKDYTSQDAKVETIIKLNEVLADYKSNIPLQTNKISQQLLEHCLWYFLREGSAPQITIEDGKEIINVNNEYDSYMFNESKTETFEIKNKTFEITHIKFKLNSDSSNTISYCAANRLVKSETIKLPGLFGTLNDDDGNFYYMCFVCSQYLTDNVNTERLDFNIAKNDVGIFSETDITFDEIRNVVTSKIGSFLDPYLSKNKELGKKRIEDFVDKSAPKYKSILNHISEENRIVDPSISDKNLELHLHKQQAAFEEKLLIEGHELMKPSAIDDYNFYSERLDDYLSKVIDLKKSDLANYVAHRKVIIDLLEKAIEKQSNGKYVKEDVIHKLIMPMIQTSNEVSLDDCNLWLLDERLAFHNYLASDTAISSMPITNSESSKEPDLLALNIYDNPILVNEGSKLPLASITVVEFKRPMRCDVGGEGEEKNPIEQALGYLERIRKGEIKTANGRTIPESKSVPGYCYVLCDLNEKMKERCKLFSLTETYDKMGYFGFNQNYNAYIEVFSFDRLLNSAKERNRSFFDKLGLPTT